MQTERYIGIDYLRAFFSACVVLVHLGYISPSTIFNKELYLVHNFTLSDFANFYILLLSVPVFFIISNYLFFQKPKDKSVLFTYLKRIGKIAAFWIVLYTILTHKGWDVINWLPKSASDLPSFVMSGGDTAYYFFISLIGLTIITHLSKFLNIFYVLVLFIITTLLVSVLPILSVATEHFVLCVYWNPLNFLPYPFAAILVFHIARLDSKIKPIYIILAGFLILLLAIADWTIYVNKGFFNVNKYAIPAYTRPSLVLIAMAVLYLAIKVNPKTNPVILFMSNYSLALYCIHPFIIYFPIKQLSRGNWVISLFIVLIPSYLTAIIMKQFIRQELIK